MVFVVVRDVDVDAVVVGQAQDMDMHRVAQAHWHWIAIGRADQPAVTSSLPLSTARFLIPS